MQTTATTTASSDAPIGSGRPRRRRRALVLSGLGVAGMALAACGASSSAGTPTSTTPGQAAPNGSGGAGGAGRQFPGTSGTIAAITGTSLEVQNPTTGQTTVNYTSATTFRQITTTSASSVTVGTCISAFGKPTDAGPRRPRTRSEAGHRHDRVGVPAGGRVLLGRIRRATRRGNGSRRWRTSVHPRLGHPRLGHPGLGVATGRSRSLRGRLVRRGIRDRSPRSTGSTVTVSETDPSTKATTSVVVTLTPTTTFSTTGTASPTDLAVGKCARATGAADSTGAVAATSITLSTPRRQRVHQRIRWIRWLPGPPVGRGRRCLILPHAPTRTPGRR